MIFDDGISTSVMKLSSPSILGMPPAQMCCPSTQSADTQFSKDSIENWVSALCVDGQHIWAGGIPKMLGEDSFITLVDMPSSKIIGRYAFKDVGHIFWIGINGDNVWFLAGLD